MARSGTNKFKPGKEKRFADEKMSEERLAWLKTFIGQFIIRVTERDEEEHSEYGDIVSIVIPRPRSAVILNLTSLTGEELRLTRQFFNAAFDMAEPLCDERDKVAQDAWNNGDDSHIRLYRSVPDLVVRSRAVGAYGQVLRDRFAGYATRSEPGLNPGARVRNVGNEVAVGVEGGPGSQDDLSTPDQPEGVREVGGAGERAGGLLPSDASEGDSSPAS